MQVITIDDQDFSALVSALRDAKRVGHYWRKGQLQVVCATRQFVLVSSDGAPNKIAIRPARNLSEAETLAMQLLMQEEQQGNEIKVNDEYRDSE
jgi:hypothetical protein